MRTANNGAVPYTNEPKLLLYGFIGDFSVSKYSSGEEGKRIADETIVKKRSSGCRCWSPSHERKRKIVSPGLSLSGASSNAGKRKNAANTKIAASTSHTQLRRAQLTAFVRVSFCAGRFASVNCAASFCDIASFALSFGVKDSFIRYHT